MEAMHLLQGAGVTAAAVLNPKQVLLDPHLRERGYFDVVEHAGAARPVPKQLGARFSAFGCGARGPAPSLGEHNREVLQGLLGLSDDELAELQEAKAIGDTPEFAVPCRAYAGDGAVAAHVLPADGRAGGAGAGLQAAAGDGLA